jgi:hypothetical protein
MNELLLLPTTHLHETISIMNIPMFPVSIMHHVLGHRDFGSIEDRGLIHVVPSIEINCGPHVLINCKEGGPVGSDFGVEEVQVG